MFHGLHRAAPTGGGTRSDPSGMNGPAGRTSPCFAQPVKSPRMDPATPSHDDWIDQARVIQRCVQGRCEAAPLHGLSLGFVCADMQHEAATLFRDAAISLGAQVTDLDPARLLSGDDASLDGVARLLGRLYDGIECQGLPAPLVRRLAQLAAVPVFDAVAAGGVAIGQSAPATPCGADERQRRLCSIQAALVLALRGEAL